MRATATHGGHGNGEAVRAEAARLLGEADPTQGGARCADGCSPGPCDFPSCMPPYTSAFVMSNEQAQAKAGELLRRASGCATSGRPAYRIVGALGPIRSPYDVGADPFEWGS